MSLPAPRASREEVVALANDYWAREGPPNLPLPLCYQIVVRAYYRDTMGKPGVNDFGINDDAFFFVSPDRFKAIRGNTDPTRLGYNPSAGKAMAVLQPGWWPFYRGAHRGRTPSLRQYEPDLADAKKIPNHGHFLVERSYGVGDQRNWHETGYFAINQHSQLGSTTSSEGCLTAPDETFDPYMSLVWEESRRLKVDTIWTGLLLGPIR